MFEKVKEFLPEDTIAYSIHGSRLYGLDSPSSDWDFMAVSKNGKSRQIISGDLDITTMSLENFADRIYSGQSSEVAVLTAGKMIFLEAAFKPFITSLRFNPLSVYDNLGSERYNHLKRAMRDDNKARVEKTFKVISRSSVMRYELPSN